MVVKDGSCEQFRNIQARLLAIRESLDVIEGNLIDYIDDSTS